MIRKSEVGFIKKAEAKAKANVEAKAKAEAEENEKSIKDLLQVMRYLKT